MSSSRNRSSAAGCSAPLPRRPSTPLGEPLLFRCPVWPSMEGLRRKPRGGRRLGVGAHAVDPGFCRKRADSLPARGELLPPPLPADSCWHSDLPSPANPEAAPRAPSWSWDPRSACAAAAAAGVPGQGFPCSSASLCPVAP